MHGPTAKKDSPHIPEGRSNQELNLPDSATYQPLPYKDWLAKDPFRDGVRRIWLCNAQTVLLKNSTSASQMSHKEIFRYL